MNIINWYRLICYTKLSKLVCLVDHSISVEATLFYLHFEHTFQNLNRFPG